MYGWLNTHLKLGLEPPVLEQDFVPLSTAEASVWDAGHPAPPGGDAHERAVTSWWRQDAARQIAAPSDAASLVAWREVIGGAIAGLSSRQERNPVDAAKVGTREWNPVAPTRSVTVVTSARGIAGLAGADGAPAPLAAALVAAGQRVIALDVTAQPGEAVNRLVANRSSAAFTFGYNPPIVVSRAHDTLAVLRHARSIAGPEGRVVLMAADGPSSAWAALALAQAGSLVDAAVFVTDGFRFGSVTSFEDPSFFPGAAKYGDLPALLAQAAPRPLWVAGESAESIKRLAAVYRLAGAPRALTVSKTSDFRAIVGWLGRLAG
jgi:hypothetical protein